MPSSMSGAGPAAVMDSMMTYMRAASVNSMTDWMTAASAATNGVVSCVSTCWMRTTSMGDVASTSNWMAAASFHCVPVGLMASAAMPNDLPMTSGPRLFRGRMSYRLRL